jgi:Bacterial TniB protein
MRSTLC